MAVISVSVFRAEKGHAADLRSVLGTYKTYLEKLGPSVQLLDVLHGGPRAGEVLLLLAAKNRAEYASNTEKILADRPNNPMAAAMGGANPPAILAGRSLLVSIDEAAPIPAPAAITESFNLQVVPGKRAEALAAVAAAQAKHASLGIGSVVTAIQEVAGPLTGTLIFSPRYDSFADQEAHRVKNLEGKLPLREAVEKGVLTINSRIIAIPYVV